MNTLTKKQTQELLENLERLHFVTKRRWEALKEFIDSKENWARDFQPKSLGAKAWTEFGKRLESAYKRLQKQSK